MPMIMKVGNIEVHAGVLSVTTTAAAGAFTVDADNLFPRGFIKYCSGQIIEPTVAYNNCFARLYRRLAGAGSVQNAQFQEADGFGLVVWQFGASAQTIYIYWIAIIERG